MHLSTYVPTNGAKYSGSRRLMQDRKLAVGLNVNCVALHCGSRVVTVEIALRLAIVMLGIYT